METSSLLSSGNARLCFLGSHSTNADTVKSSYHAICTTIRTYIHGAYPTMVVIPRCIVPGYGIGFDTHTLRDHDLTS